MPGHVLRDPFLKARPVTIYRFCDYCGEQILSGADLVRLETTDRRRYGRDLVGEYHDYCWQTLWDGFKLIEEYGGSLEHIRVATSQAIVARKRKHRFPEADSE
jgi:hypothetical protein